MESIQALKTVYDANARSYVMDLFFAAKYQEIVEVLRDSPIGGEAYDLLTELDLSHVADYEILIQ